MHGPYFLWVRHVEGKQVNRTLRPGPKLERVKKGIENFRRAQELMSRLLRVEESLILDEKDAGAEEGKKNFKARLPRQ